MSNWGKDDAAEAQRRREQAAEAKGWATVTGATTVTSSGTGTSWPTALPNTGIGLGVSGGVIGRPAPSQWELDEARYRREMEEFQDRIIRQAQQKELEERFRRGDPNIYFDSAIDKYIEIHGLPTTAPKPENAIKATTHKAGHFPVDWMIAAYERAQTSDILVTIQVEKDGVVVIGQAGDDYETVVLSWTMMQQAKTNPVVIGVETVERHLDTLANLKRRVKAK